VAEVCSEQSHSTHDQDAKKTGKVPTIPLKGTPPTTRKPPTKTHHLMSPPSPQIFMLGTKTLTQGPLGDI
jgi:hypothetical protein